MKTIVSALLAIAFAACATPAILTPAQVPGQCAVRDTDCGRDASGVRWCCDEGDACGGGPFNGCPAEMCCTSGDDGMPGARAPRKQRRAQ